METEWSLLLKNGFQKNQKVVEQFVKTHQTKNEKKENNEKEALLDSRD